MMTNYVHGAIDLSSLMTTVLLIIAVVCIFYLRWQKRKAFVRYIDSFPGPEYHSILGHAPLFNLPRHQRFPKVIELLKDFQKEPVVRLWVGNEYRIFLLNPESIEVVLSHPKELIKSPQYRLLRSWLGEGLVFSDGSKWHSRRRLLTPTFHFKILQAFLDIFNEQASIFCDKKVRPNVGVGLDYADKLANLTLDIICETAMGQSVNAQGDGESDYVKAVSDAQEVFSHRSLNPFYRNDFIFRLTRWGRIWNKHLKVLHTFTKKVIKERKKEFEAKKQLDSDQPLLDLNDNVYIGSEQKRFAFLDMLLESAESNRLTDSDIQEEVDTFMFEGHDTTANAFTWILFHLGHHPEVQQKLIEEIDYVFGGDESRWVTSEDLRDLKYMECVIKESLRLHPPVPFFGRTLNSDLTVGNYVIPSGSVVMMSAYFAHRDPKHYVNPDEFEPERFLSENNRGRHPYAFIPFSAGPRNCIGQKFAMMEMKTVLAHIFRKYRVTSLQTYDELQVVAEITLRTINGLKLKFHER
ncbi:hypothetical protein CHUAL_000821 [Chamberlinius hualienensis]